MPFDSARDYFDPFPGLAAGLQIGHAVAQKQYQDESLALAKRRQNIDDQEELRRQVAQNEHALQIAEDRDAAANFQFQFQRAADEELSALPPEKRGNEDEIRNAQGRAYRKSLPYLPPHLLATALNQQATQSAITDRTKAGIDNKFAMLDARLASQEWQASLKEDAKGVSEDEFVNRHLEGHAKRTGLGTSVADSELRQLYRKNHAKDGSAPAIGEVTPEVPDILTQLQNAKEAGITKAKVESGSVVPVEHFWQGGTKIDELIKKEELNQKIKGSPAAPKASTPKSSGGKRVFKYDAKTGGIKE